MSSHLIFEQLSILPSSGFQDYFNRYGYIGIYVWFITIDQLAPIPEEITLIAIGYLAAHALISPFLAGVFSIAAFITVDTVYFFLTQSGNKFIGRITKKANGLLIRRYRRKMKEHTFKTLLILCFIPRMRLFSPVFVALMKFPYPKFLLYDAIGLTAFSAVYISLGMIFHNSVSSLMKKSEVFGYVIFGAAILFIIIFSIVMFRKRK